MKIKPNFPGLGTQKNNAIPTEDFSLNVELVETLQANHTPSIEKSANSNVVHVEKTSTVALGSKGSYGKPVSLPILNYEWEIVDSKPLKLGLARLILHRPPYSNNPDLFLLQATASFGVYQDQICGLSVELALKAAWVTDRSDRWQPCDNPHATPSPMGQIWFNGGVWEIAPGKGRRVLRGTPLNRTTLCTMEKKRNGELCLTISLQSRPTDLNIVFRDKMLARPTKKSAILKRFLQQCAVERDAQIITWNESYVQQREKS